MAISEKRIREITKEEITKWQAQTISDSLAFNKKLVEQANKKIRKGK